MLPDEQDAGYLWDMLDAARGVSGEFRQAHPEIPWRSIIGQRSVLAHDYGEIRHDRVWEVVAVHNPALIALLEPLIPSSPTEKGA